MPVASCTAGNSTRLDARSSISSRAWPQATRPSPRRSGTRNSSSPTNNSNRSDRPACRPHDREETRLKLVRFGSAGAERPGLVLADGAIADLTGTIPDLAGAALSPDSLAKLRALDAAKLPRAPSNARLGACVGGVCKFIAIGLNYADH